MIKGLTSQQVQELTAKGLVNSFSPRPEKKVITIILKNIFIIFNIIIFPFLFVLFMMGQYKDAISVGVVALINTFTNIYQEIKAKIALDKIKLKNPELTTVIRNGERQPIPTKSIVLGDYITLKPGELAPADGTVIESNHLEMDESILTGESDYLFKPKNSKILSGSFAAAGEGVFRADKIGKDGYMQQIVLNSKKSKPLKTLLEKKINKLVNSFLFLCFLAATILIIKYRPFSQNLIEPIRYIVASITSMIPQGLVLLVTVTFVLSVIKFAKQKVIFRRINSIEGLANVDLICMDKTGTLTYNHIKLDKIISTHDYTEKELSQILGDMAALVTTKNKTMEAIEKKFPEHTGKKIDEIPFKSINKYSCIRISKNKIIEDIIIGAFEKIRPFLNKKETTLIQNKIKQHESQGFRTIAIATKQQKPANLKPLQSNLDDFNLAGIIVFSEEIKENTSKILKGFRKRGVRQIVISGDSLTTVQAISARVGIPNSDQGMSGEDIENCSPALLKEKILSKNIFGRINPQQKKTIVTTFKDAGYYTAMVGDGVNDILALKEADVSFAMGAGGSMAKDVSDIVLLNNKFDILPKLLAEGEKIISRIGDAAKIFSLKNIFALFTITFALAIGFPFPYLPQHITLLNLTTISIPLLYLISFSRHRNQVKGDFIKNILSFSFTFGGIAALSSILINILYLKGFMETATKSRTISILFLIIITLNLFMFLMNRAKKFKDIFKDKKAFIVYLLGILLLPISIYSSLLRNFFEFSLLDNRDWLIIIPLTIFVSAIQFQIYKRKIN